MRYHRTNKKGEYGMTGIYLEVKEDLKKEVNSTKEPYYIDINLFTKIINLYYKKVFQYIIDELGVFKLHNRLGYLFVSKSVCIRYNPKKIYFVTENGKKIRKEQNIELFNGRWPYMFWDSEKKWRIFKFIPASKFKKKIVENEKNGIKYPIMDLKDYGRRGADSYVQIRK